MSRRIKSLQVRLTLELAALFFVASCLAVGGLIYSASLTAGSLGDRELGLRAADPGEEGHRCVFWSSRMKNAFPAS